MSDPIRVQTGATRAELIELVRRIREHGLLRWPLWDERAPGYRGDPLPLSDYEGAIIRAALLAAADGLR